MIDVLVLYYSRQGSTRALAEEIAAGVDSVRGAQARLRTVAPVATGIERDVNPIPDFGPPYCELADLAQCAALALGSPTRFGNMAAPLKHFLDQTGALWQSGALAGKPAAVFTSSSSAHGGQESTLLSMMIPLLHHGMLILGLPYANADLATSLDGGSPYGAGHIARHGEAPERLTDSERRLGMELGRRLALTALRLSAT